MDWQPFGRNRLCRLDKFNTDYSDTNVRSYGSYKWSFYFTFTGDWSQRQEENRKSYCYFAYRCSCIFITGYIGAWTILILYFERFEYTCWNVWYGV